MRDFLNNQAKVKNTLENLYSHPDPLQIVYDNKNSEDIEFIALIAALFAYGNAGAILKFLKKIDFSLLNASDEKIRKTNLKYRFQSVLDVQEILITLKRLKQETSIKELSENVYKKAKEPKLLHVIWELIDKIYSLNPYKSTGYEFFFSKKNITSAYKRYCMYYRWMVRDDSLDLGLFSSISKADLLMPLDTHTHKMGLLLGLINRKQANQKAMLELSAKLKSFCNDDPLKYDFCLYRLSQLHSKDEILSLLKENNIDI